MTVDVPDFDEELTGMAAVIFEEDDDERCHAVVSEYDEEGQYNETECGTRVPESDDVKPRQSFEDADMCPECWPESIL